MAVEPFHVFSIPIKSDDFEEGISGIQCSLKFEYTELYPDEPPEIEITTENAFEFDTDELKEHLIQQVSLTD